VDVVAKGTRALAEVEDHTQPSRVLLSAGLIIKNLLVDSTILRNPADSMETADVMASLARTLSRCAAIQA
jgi:hypothetical protein